MGLLDSLSIGASGLTAQQAALQITGNNIANAATPGYARQLPQLTASGQTMLGRGLSTGAGVNLTDVRRMIDAAVQERLYSANGQVAYHTTADQMLSRVEALMNEMTGTDVSSALTELFNSFSALAQSPQDGALRGVVLQRAITVADRLNYIRDGLERIRLDVDSAMQGAVEEADRLAAAIADINVKIVAAESGGSTAASLRDQRDALLGRLSEVVGITTREDANGAVNVFLGSEPIVYHGASRGLRLDTQLVNGQPRQVVVFADDRGAVKLTGGRIAALQATRDGQLAATIERFDALAAQLIWQVNRIHASGTAMEGFAELTGTYQVLDAGAPLASTAAGLPFPPVNGSVLVTVTNTVTGARTTRQINVNVGGSGPQTTLNDVLAALNAVPDLAAGVDATGRLSLHTTDANVRVSFGEDSACVLAALGLNTFFAGSDASTITVNAFVLAEPGRIAAGLSGQPGDGENAARIAALAESPVAELGRMSLPAFHQRLVSDLAVWSSSAADMANANLVVQESLAAQREAVSGVSLDEEAVNLIRFQRAFQGSARFITIVNELMETLLQLA